MAKRTRPRRDEAAPAEGGLSRIHLAAVKSTKQLEIRRAQASGHPASASLKVEVCLPGGLELRPCSPAGRVGHARGGKRRPTLAHLRRGGTILATVGNSEGRRRVHFAQGVRYFRGMGGAEGFATFRHLIEEVDPGRGS